MSVSVVGAGADWLGMRWSFLACALVTVVGIPFVAGMPGKGGRTSPSAGAAAPSAGEDSV